MAERQNRHCGDWYPFPVRRKTPSFRAWRMSNRVKTETRNDSGGKTMMSRKIPLYGGGHESAIITCCIYAGTTRPAACGH
ncbi:hypothetical protein GRL19_004436 [Salmonella enterica]|nr:hypothetical protein [Salmonella enterica]